MNSTQSSNSATDKNTKVVVLAGWLGCQPKHLRRYSQLYKQNGWDSLIRICSPKSVVMEAMTTGPTGTDSTLRFSSNKSVQSSSSEIKDLAMNTLQELHAIQPSHIIIHAFSNNGCFLWEWLRFLLYDDNSPLLSSSSTNENADVSTTTIDIQNLRQNLIGIIFDSAPAYYGGKTDTLQSALQYVSSVSERKHLQNYVTTSLPQGVVKQRFRDFWYGLCSGGDDDDDDDTKTNSIPQLYLYSQCDKLASYKHLEDLIAYREKMLLLRNNGKKKRKNNGTSMSMIWKHKFDESEHCCHLLKYPEMYGSLIKQFLGFCTTHPCGCANGMCNTSSNLYASLRSKL